MRSLITVGFALAVASVGPTASAQDFVGLGDGSDGMIHIRDGVRPTLHYVPIADASGPTLIAEEPPVGFAVGDAVIVWQSSFDAARRAEDEALLGRVFLTRIASLSGREFVLAETPTWSVQHGAQLVRVIEAEELRIEPGQTWYGDHFHGTKHGMLAIFSRTEVRIDGDIDIVGGGYGPGETAIAAELRCGELLMAGDFAGRGGGGAFFYTPSRCGAEFGCGADPIGLGGGGAIGFQMGGGGGSNAGAGGSAYPPGECMLPTSPASGGPAAPGRDDTIFLGGGGGGSSLLGAPGTLAGGAGGGVIFIRGANVNGNGGVIADGADGDGGGGGAGGTIVIQSAGELSVCSLYARGGDAGDYSGAGGGGRIVVFGGDTTCLTDDLVARGDPSMAGGIAEDGRIERMPALDCGRCAAAGLLCDEITYACERCASDDDCDAHGPSFACAPEGTCYDACAGLCAGGERCVPSPMGGYECAAPSGCTIDGECRLGLCDVAMNVCVPGACRETDHCADDRRCDPDPAHPGLGICVRDVMRPGPLPRPDQFTFSGGGGCSTAHTHGSELAWIALVLLALRRRR